jgi:hypothetical protein
MEISQLTPAEQKRVEETLQEMLQKGKEDICYFISKFCWTFDPRVPKGTSPHLRFELFNFQKRLVRDVVDAIHSGEDIFIEKSRDMGVSYTMVAFFLWFWLFEPASNFLVGSRKEDYVDNRRGGTTGNKEESLFGKLDYMISRLPSFVLPKGFNYEKHFNFMSLVNPENGNVISGESSNLNFSRGSRHKAILLDEFAFWDNGDAVWGSTADTTHCRIVVTTPGNKPSKAKRLRFNKDGEKIKVISLIWSLDPRKNKAWYNAEAARRSPDHFAREVLLNWELSMTGRVYPEIADAVTGKYPFMTSQPFYCAWDFGLDGTCFSFWQINPENGKARLIDAYENTDKPIQWYFPFFRGAIDSTFTYTDEDLEAINQIKTYAKAIHFGDPDVRKRSLLTGTTTKKELERVKVYVQSTTKNDFYIRREKTKIWLQKGIEINDNKRTQFFIECVSAARYPERQETSQATTPVALPIHDFSSHARTSMEYFFMNIARFTESLNKEPDWVKNSGRYMTNRRNLRIRR